MSATLTAHPPASRSARFVLPAGSPWVRNLAALWAADPALAAVIEETWPAETDRAGDGPDESVEGSVSVNPSRRGPPTAAWTPRGAGARPVSLHSRHDPLEEGRTWARAADLEDKLVFFVHGLGLGYHVEALFERASAEATLIVFEPCVAVIAAACRHRDLSAMLGSGRLILASQLDRASLFGRLMPLSAAAHVGSVVLKHEPSVRIAPARHAEFEQLTADFLAYARTCVNTLVLNGRRTAENVTRNLPWYVATPSLARLAGAFAGQPALIVSAGPSLRKNKHLLRDASGRAVVIAVQTTLKPMLELGVEPHFVTSLDYHDICTRFFEHLPSGLRTELIAEPKATDAIFDLMPGPVSLLGNEYADGLLAELNTEKARLPAGATVAHLAFYLAEHLGCSPIIFVGQDLGFSDGLCYAPGTSYEDVWRPEMGRFCSVEQKQWEQIVRDRNILRRVPDHLGRPTYTEERLFTYLQHFERDFARSRAKVVDATEGGVLKRGAEPMPLAEAIARFCHNPLRDGRARHHGLRFDRLHDAARCLRRRLDEAGTIERISTQTFELLSEIREHLSDQRRVNRAIAEIDRLRVQLEPLGRTYHLVTQLTQQSEMKRFVADRRIAAAGVEGTERQRRQVERDLANVEAIRVAAGEFHGIVTDALRRVESFAERQQAGRAAA